ncbi:MAG: OB-fold domain-containing protein [Dehalococcoidia bacterium]|nr:OB-fold domain-containing protein [Dehalococcoidia bacterium]
MNVVYPSHPALRDRVPDNVVLVALAGASDVRMVGNLVDCPYPEIRIGMEVEVVFEDHPESDLTLPRWPPSP